MRNKPQTTALVPVQHKDWIVPFTKTEDFLSMMEVFGTFIQFGDLERISFPTGKSTMFEIMDKEMNATQAESLIGVIIHCHPHRAYYPHAYGHPAADKIPLCVSPDNQFGFRDTMSQFDIEKNFPTLLYTEPETGIKKYLFGEMPCARCILNQFGTASRYTIGKPESAKSKACGDRYSIYFWPMEITGENTFNPIQKFPTRIDVPPTSTKKFRSFILAMENRGIPFWENVVEISLTTNTSQGNIAYPELEIEKKIDRSVISPEIKSTFTSYREAIKTKIARSKDLRDIIED